MAISATVSIGDGQFTPFFQDVRGGKEGTSPVGTVSQTLSDTGDGSGGTVTLIYTMARLPFGFRAIIVPTYVVALDTLGTAEAIRMNFTAVGNRRLTNSFDQITLAIAGQGQNQAKFDEAGIVIESDLLAETQVLSFIWSTNTNAVVYSARLFAAVFDAEVIEAQGSISDFLAGVR